MNYTEIKKNYVDRKYTTTLPYPFSRIKMSDEKRKEIKDAYRNDNMAKGRLFKQDLRIWATEVLGKITDKQFDPLYNKAYEDGHSGGHMEVAGTFQDLLDLIEEFVKK